MSHNLRFRSNFWRATVFLAVMVGLQLTCTNPRVNLEAGVGPRQDVPGGIPGPHMANSYTFYKYNVSCPTFTVGTGSSFQWDKTGTTLYGQVTGGSEIYFTATPNQAADVYVQYTGNLASLGVPTAQVNITWYCFVYPDGETYAEWQTRENGGAWTTISGTHVTNDDGMSERVYSYSLADLGYDAGTTSLYIRVVGHFAANIYNHQFHVHLFQIGTFWSTISDPATSGNWTNFGTTLPLTVEITRCGSQSGLYNDVYYYRMYYGPNPQVNSTCSYRGAWQNSSSSFPGGGNYGKLFFNVPITPPTRIYYRFYISAASSAEYWSDTYAVDFYDTSAPTYGEPLTFSDSNDTLEIGQPFNISGSAADTGGAGLKNITCFWRIAASPVNKSLFDGIQTQTLTGNAAAFSIQIPAGAFQLNTPTDFILYFYDTFDNENVTSQFEITPQDRTAPTIVPDINATLPISYTKDKRVTFTITEDPVASGVNHSAVYGFYAINNSLFAVASPLANDSHQADDWGYCIQSGNLTYNMTIYVWLKA